MIEPSDDVLQRRLRGRVFQHDVGIVARDDVPGCRRQPLQGPVGIEHLANVKSRREWTVRRQVIVIVCGIRGEHDPTPSGVDAHRLQPVGVPIGRMQRQAGRNFDFGKFDA